METQRRGEHNAATFHLMPANGGCLRIEILQSANNLGNSGVLTRSKCGMWGYPSYPGLKKTAFFMHNFIPLLRSLPSWFLYHVLYIRFPTLEMRGQNSIDAIEITEVYCQFTLNQITDS